MTNDRKAIYVSVCFIVYSVIMTGLVWFLKAMDANFVFGANAGFFFACGLFFLISKRMRNLA